MAAITITDFTRAGTDPTAVDQAAASGDYIENTGQEVLFILNGGMGSITLTIDFPDTAVIDDQAPSNRTVTVGAGVYKMVGPFDPSTYNDANGRVQLSYSGTTTVTVAAFRLTP